MAATSPSSTSILLIFTTITLTSLTFPSTAQDSPQDYVDAHNAARSAVGMGPVSWDARLASYADQRAAADCHLVHSGGPYGENLAWSSGELSGADANNKDAVAMWVGEKADYDYNSNGCAPGKQCGHYTQVVWRSSTGIWCAKANCSGGRGTFVICSHNPPGNYVGQKPY